MPPTLPHRILHRMNPPDKLAKLERLARLREPEAPSRSALLSFLLVGLALGVYWAYGAITAGSVGIALNKLGLLFMALMFSAQFSGELLYPGTAGRLLRVLARLVLLPAALAFFLAYLYQDFGAYGLLGGAIFVLCLAVIVWLAARFSGSTRERRR